ncbi:hypothetical protein HZB02_02345 [Candidatus Woesearchaeota archaeon]|nr:hypothetical protein [Candidatus Woesearchaeota archaeon]
MVLDLNIIKSKFGKQVLNNYFGIDFTERIPVADLPQAAQPLTSSASQVSALPAAKQEKPAPKNKSSPGNGSFDPFKTDGETRSVISFPPVGVREVLQPPSVSPAISPYDLTQYLRNCSVVGEEANGILLTVSLSSGMHTILEGESGSGKSHLMQAVLSLFPKSEVCTVEQVSGQAIWHFADQLNQARIVYFPELQKVVADRNRKHAGIVELMKSIAEGKDASRMVTNTSHDGVDTYCISKEKTLVATLATENDFVYDREFQRRFLFLNTDASPQHIREIIDHKVTDRIAATLSSRYDPLEERLSSRVTELGHRDDLYVLNPFLPYLRRSFPNSSKTQAYLEHYLNLFEAWGKFFHDDHQQISLYGKTFVLLNLEDVYHVYSAYHDSFLRTLESFSGEQALHFSPDWKTCFLEGVSVANTLISVGDGTDRSVLGQEYPQLIAAWRDAQMEGSSIYARSYSTGERFILADLRQPAPAALSHTHSSYVTPITDPARMLPAYCEHHDTT